jgi:flagellar basal-body rod modification protein FlgD
MSSTSGVNGTSSTAGTSTNTASSTVPTITQTLGENDFLNLLVTELQNQDPMQPMDDTQSIAELAQFSALQEMTNVATAVNTLNQTMTNYIQQSGLIEGSSMIGKSVSGLASDGTTQISGIVKSVTVSGGDTQLQITEDDGTTVTMPLSKVTSVQAAVTTPTSTTTDTTATTGTTTDTTATTGTTTGTTATT